MTSSRTSNRKVATWSDEMCQNEIVSLIEEQTGEKVEFDRVGSEQLERGVEVV